MKFIVTGKNLVVTESLKEKAISKLSKLDKFVNPGTEVHVTMSIRKENHKEKHVAEVTILFHGVFIRAEESSDDMYNSINKVIDVLEKQVKKNRTRLERKIHDGGSLRFDGFNSDNTESVGEDDFSVVRSKKFSSKPMDVEEAILQLNLIGHSFFVFYNSETNKANVVYKRHDGNYGLIEPEL
ncbi:MAG: ribosome-associated translation inhibitor RaiA [Bacillota bacterium]